MDDSLKKLQGISDALDNLNRELSDEERVWAEELADRQRLGLEGDAAISHYNDWMDRHGMGHLKVPGQENDAMDTMSKGKLAFAQMRECAARNGLQDMSLEEINEIIHDVRYGSSKQ